MEVDYQALFRIKTPEGATPPTIADISTMLALAFMWLAQELQRHGNLEIKLISVNISDWNSKDEKATTFLPETTRLSTETSIEISPTNAPEISTSNDSDAVP